LNIEPFTPNTPYLADFFSKLKDFCDIRNTGWKFKMFLGLQNQRNIVQGFALICLLRCSLIDLSTLTTMEALRKKEMKLSSPKTIEDVVALGPTA
jgi:hypothetical protein